MHVELWDALDLGADAAHTPSVVAIVGGGGKTSVLYQLGREAEQRGQRAILAGTARFTPAPASRMPPIVRGDQSRIIGAIENALRTSPVIVAAPHDESKGRLSTLSVETVDACAAIDGLGLIALEADGSKMLPFKAPGENEPVVPASATHVVSIVGPDAIDAPLDADHVHRPERIRAIVGADAATCTIDVLARVLASTSGGRKHVGDRAYAVLVNKCELAPQRATELGQALREAGVPRVILASLHDAEHPVRELLV
jgi:probable selenium-dependent hydroxylase accessory protein YqeC